MNTEQRQCVWNYDAYCVYLKGKKCPYNSDNCGDCLHMVWKDECVLSEMFDRFIKIKEKNDA